MALERALIRLIAVRTDVSDWSVCLTKKCFEVHDRSHNARDGFVHFFGYIDSSEEIAQVRKLTLTIDVPDRGRDDLETRRF